MQRIGGLQSVHAPVGFAHGWYRLHPLCAESIRRRRRQHKHLVRPRRAAAGIHVSKNADLRKLVVFAFELQQDISFGVGAPLHNVKQRSAKSSKKYSAIQVVELPTAPFQKKTRCKMQDARQGEDKTNVNCRRGQNTAARRAQRHGAHPRKVVLNGPCWFQNARRV